MPIIAKFYGLVIKMYFRQSEHNPPHFHAFYGDYVGVFNITTLTIMEGNLPFRAQNLVKEWATIHQSELMTIWKTQIFSRLPPLK